ncbi:acyl-CoA thioesterase [Sphingomonas jatrophae]|uniref:Acyl-CoA thioester hydrolase n=1 Tax=Sphingomonas jatrophae TaxID=1166337 RepID=A0A1I6MAH1_9SPHN|nr:acyl-CoA thioesterase [Sphingomonas jatrophae]SFS12651.1 acyl-CoA thioester hydrolase [Sphingomonas jatrophae]
MTPFELTLTAGPADIDILGHVNNAVWVRWMEEVATAHWHALAYPAHVEAYVWVVTRHEIDYLRALGPGGTVTARTWVPDPPQGARMDRLMEFVGEGGRIHVKARTTWAIVDKASGRPLRVPPHVVAPFSAG